MFFDAASVVAAHGWKIPASFGPLHIWTYHLF